LRTPDKGVEEHFSSSGLRKRRSCGSGRALGGAFASEWYQSRENFFAFCSREEEKISPCCRGEKDNHLIQRIGRTREEEGDKHRIQKWRGRYVISE
jgi:hypothetical protein